MKRRAAYVPVHRTHRLYFRLWRGYWLRTRWFILNAETESGGRIQAVADILYPYTFRGKPRIIVKEWT